MSNKKRIQNGYIFGNQTSIQMFDNGTTPRALSDTFNSERLNRVEFKHINEVFAVMVGQEQMTGITLKEQIPVKNADGDFHRYTIITDVPLNKVNAAVKTAKDQIYCSPH